MSNKSSHYLLECDDFLFMVSSQLQMTSQLTSRTSYTKYRGDYGSKQENRYLWMAIESKTTIRPVTGQPDT